MTPTDRLVDLYYTITKSERKKERKRENSVKKT